MTKRFLFLFLWAVPCFAGSIRLINDSPYPLRAVIRGYDGTYLGEMIVNPEHALTWNDAGGQIGYFGKGNVYQEQSTRSQTPYTVLWYCTEGADYAVCDGIPTGATVSAQSCTGTRQCKPQKKKQGPFPNQPEDHFLQKEEQREEGSVGAPQY
jgi:hypothetical protein